MPHSHGLRRSTRNVFSQPYKRHGLPAPTKYLTNYKLGDYVDIKANSAIHKGMPHKFYHGKTGRVWNITPRAIGVECNKRVGGRILRKRIHVRIEHVNPSKSRQDFLVRVQANDQKRQEAKKKGEKLAKGVLKRQPGQPNPAALVKTRKTQIVDVQPLVYEDLA